MAYEKQTFVDHEVDSNGNVVTQGTTIKAGHFNHIEDGIDALDKRITAVDGGASGESLMSVKLENGSKMTIRCKDWTDTEDFVWVFDGVGGQNKTANLQNCGTILKSVADTSLAYNMSKTVYKDCSDDTAPLQFKGSYFSGNHAATIATTINVVSHSLTTADIGSTWVDSDASTPTEYMLVKVDSAKKLTFVDKAFAGVSVAYNSAKHTPISPLKHVKNATNTGDVTFTSFANGGQLYSGDNHIVNKYYVDDVEITENGLYTGSKVHNLCSYDVIYVPAIFEYLEANVGKNTNTSHQSDDIVEKYLHVDIIHEFRPNGSQTTYCNFQVGEREDLNFYYLYSAQVIAPGAAPTYLYVPGTNDDAILTHDGSETIGFKPDVWNDENVAPYRYFTLSTDKTKGFEIVFSRDTYWGKNENRITKIKRYNGAGWSPSTRKLYPIFTATTFPAGSSFDAVTGRIPLNAALKNGTTAVCWHWEHDDIILTIDSHEKCNANIPLSSYMQNKRVEVLDVTSSVISYPPYRTGESLHYATNADIGHLVVRLYD